MVILRLQLQFWLLSIIFLLIACSKQSGASVILNIFEYEAISKQDRMKMAFETLTLPNGSNLDDVVAQYSVLKSLYMLNLRNLKHLSNKLTLHMNF